WLKVSCGDHRPLSARSKVSCGIRNGLLEMAKSVLRWLQHGFWDGKKAPAAAADHFSRCQKRAVTEKTAFFDLPEPLSPMTELILQAFRYGADAVGLPDHQRVKHDPHLDFASDRHMRALRGHDHQIERRPERGELDAIERGDIAVQVAKKFAVRLHLTAAGSRPPACSECSVVRAGNRHQPLHAGESAHALDVIAADEPAHAEADEIDALAFVKIRVDECRELAREFIDAGLAPAWLQSRSQNRPAL